MGFLKKNILDIVEKPLRRHRETLYFVLKRIEFYTIQIQANLLILNKLTTSKS